jgi:Tfp pilus assembly protein PilN
MRYSINLATRTHLDHRLINRITLVTIVILILIAGWNISRVASNLGELSRMNSEIGAIQSKLSAKPSGISEAEISNQKARIRFYNEIIARKSLNWLNILDSFEDVTPEGISLSSLTPGKDKEEWKLGGRARSFNAVQQYIEKLESAKSFSNILLLSHQNMVVGQNDHGVQFNISCRVHN